MAYTDDEFNTLLREYYPSGKYLNDITEQERMFSAFYRVRAVDRTRNLNQLNEYKIISEIPTGLTSLSFEEVVDEQAIRIKNETKDKNIFLLWSGGIDSTLVFYALVKQDIEFTVIMDSNSIKEYELLGNKILNKEFNKVNFILNKEHEQFDISTLSSNPVNVFITGEIGDQIFGSALSLPFSYEDRQKHYKDALPYEAQWKDLEPTVAAVVDNLETTTLAEWFWAVNFTCKYQNILTRMTVKFEISPISPFDNCYHFFDTDNFQRWSMQNYKSNSSFVKVSDYKMQAKNYIFNINKDSNYRDNKIKVPSLINNTLIIPGRVEVKYQQI